MGIEFTRGEASESTGFGGIESSNQPRVEVGRKMAVVTCVSNVMRVQPHVSE